jgi:methyl-accepting chemotaxis protein
MIPTWAAVLGAVSLVVIALAALTTAVAVLAAAVGVRSFLASLRGTVEPVVRDVRGLIGTIRMEADGLAETSRDLRQRIVSAADAAEAKLSELGETLETAEREITETARDAAATARTVRRGASIWKLGRAIRERRRRGAPEGGAD